MDLLSLMDERHLLLYHVPCCAKLKRQIAAIDNHETAARYEVGTAANKAAATQSLLRLV